MNAITRRGLMAGTAASSLAACTVSSGTASLDIGRVLADSQAVITSLSALVASPSLAGALGRNAAKAQAAFAQASSALAQIEAMTGSTVTVSLDTATVQSLVNSLVDDAQTVLGYVEAALKLVPSPTSATLGDYVAAAQALLPYIQIAAQIIAAVAVPKEAAHISEGRALAVAMQARPV